MVSGFSLSCYIFPTLLYPLFTHLCVYFHHFLLSKRTKNVPWHILAPAAVACDIYLIRRSVHPRGAFFTLQESNFL